MSATDSRWVRASSSGTTKAGSFSVKLALPKDTRPGAYDLRIWIEGANAAAMGSAKVTVSA